MQECVFTNWKEKHKLYEKLFADFHKTSMAKLLFARDENRRRKAAA
jgi:hypothetical protein